MTAFILAVFASFFAIMNPILNTPIFISLTKGLSKAEKKRVAAKSTVVAFLIILVLSFFGKMIFQMFGLTLPAFRITGGILVFLLGIELLHGKSSKSKEPVDEEESEEDTQLALALTPLAIPILAGPGTIVTAVNFVAKGSLLQDIMTVSVFASMCLLTYIMFVSGEKIIHYLGKDAVAVIGRFMGLILATLGIHMLSQGIYGSVIEGIQFVTEHQ